mgnify:FL=1
MMYFIYNFSSQTGSESGSLSYEVSKIIILAYNKLLFKGYDNMTLNELIALIHPYVRKTAHITEYFLLAASISFPLYVYRIRGFALTLLAGAFCVGFACLDEYHQSFVAGRTPAKKDVIIDSCGAFLGIFITRIICFIGRKTVFAPLAIKRD